MAFCTYCRAELSSKSNLNKHLRYFARKPDGSRGSHPREGSEEFTTLKNERGMWTATNFGSDEEDKKKTELEERRARTNQKHYQKRVKDYQKQAAKELLKLR